MKDENKANAYSFRELQWDTKYFGVSCAKAILYKSLIKVEWDCLKEKFSDYQFISIVNRNSEHLNACLIGMETTSFLVDVNIQLKKKINATCNMPNGIKIYQSMKRDDRILEIADFPFSKFKEDPKLAKRGGANVYRQWLINSFGNPEKFYAVAESDGEINGYILHSYSDRTCTAELIAVSSKKTRGGIGTNLVKAVEYAASQQGCVELKVGTQVRNFGAINFYQKCGCKQVESHQVYHLWNI